MVKNKLYKKISYKARRLVVIYTQLTTYVLCDTQGYSGLLMIKCISVCLLREPRTDKQTSYIVIYTNVLELIYLLHKVTVLRHCASFKFNATSANGLYSKKN